MSRRTDSGLDGILLIDKPAGWTSHDVVARARRITGQRRIGHTGTLDPMATGLLVLCLGNATRLVEFLTGHDKRYTGTLTLGRTTTTDDAEGETLAEFPVPSLTQDSLDAATGQFRGPIQQLPPSFSALKVGGRRAYALARSGEVPALAPRPVTIHSLEATLATNDTISLDLTCSSGTYVRSLARDLGEALGTGAHLSSLRRESAGPFSLASAVTLEATEQAAATAALDGLIVPADEGILEHGSRHLERRRSPFSRQWSGLEHGVSARRRPFASPNLFRSRASFVGVGSVSSLGRIHASRVLQRNKSLN